MFKRIYWLAAYSCLMLLYSYAALAKGIGPEESLRLQVVYQGFFSAGSEMPIADVVLRTRKPGQAPYWETSVDVSSKAYGFVESMYPIRYQFHSWYLADRSTCLAAEYYEQNNHKKPRHRLIYFDRKKRDFITHDIAVEGALSLPALKAGRYKIRQHTASLKRFDRLGLLQHVRTLPLRVGYEASMPVSNGKKMLRYRVRVEKRGQIEVAGKTWPVLKVRLDGLKQKKLNDGSDNYAHPPLHIWLSDDEKRLPLRGIVRHSVGRFTFELVGQDAGIEPLVRVATGEEPDS